MAGDAITQPFTGHQTPLRDQRSMIGLTLHETVEDVEQAWQDWIEKNGIPNRRKGGDYSTDLRHSRKTLVAYVSGGTWIADCPGCGDGVACWPDNPHGACLGCGTIYKIDHPAEDEQARARDTLAHRYAPDRNWHRHNGETIDELERETDQLLARRDQEGIVGVVSADEIGRVLGDEAVQKLREAGAV